MPRPSRDPESTKYADTDRIFYRGQWRTPESIERQRERRRGSYQSKRPLGLLPGHIDKDGYVRIGQSTYLHRLVMATVVGRDLTPVERVHHVNENKIDNRAENLWLWPNNAAHTAWHEMQRQGHELQVYMPPVPLAHCSTDGSPHEQD